MAQSAFTSTESTSSSASTVAPVPPYEQGRRLHIVLDLDHTLVNANEGQQRHHPPDAHARPLHSFVMYNTENGTYPRYLLGLRDVLHRAALNLIDGLASSGWMAWPEGEDGMSIRIDDRRAELLSGRTSLWAAPGRLPDSLRSVSRAPLRHVDVGTGLFEVNGCDSQINSDTGVQ